MINADAIVAFPGAGLEVPEAVVLAILGPGAESFGESKVQNAPVGGAACGQDKRVLLPGFGTSGVDILRDYSNPQPLTLVPHRLTNP